MVCAMAVSTLVIVPSYNERENIAVLLERLLQVSQDIDVLVVDDDSPDGTSRIVQSIADGSDGRVALLRRRRKGGRGSAVLAGFRYALDRSYTFIFEMDADLSHPPEEIPLFLEKIVSCDLVVGSRYLPGGEIHHWGRRRTLLSRWANRYARLVLRIPLTDYTNGFRCYRRSALEALDMDAIDATGYVVLSEVAYQLHRKGLRIAEVPTVFVNRRRGASNLCFREIKEAFLSVLRIRWAYGRSRG
jgi:dolichol-phosphate mannosyltransferase